MSEITFTETGLNIMFIGRLKIKRQFRKLTNC